MPWWIKKMAISSSPVELCMCLHSSFPLSSQQREKWAHVYSLTDRYWNAYPGQLASDSIKRRFLHNPQGGSPGNVHTQQKFRKIQEEEEHFRENRHRPNFYTFLHICKRANENILLSTFLLFPTAEPIWTKFGDTVPYTQLLRSWFQPKIPPPSLVRGVHDFIIRLRNSVPPFTFLFFACKILFFCRNYCKLHDTCQAPEVFFAHALGTVVFPSSPTVTAATS